MSPPSPDPTGRESYPEVMATAPSICVHICVVQVCQRPPVKLYNCFIPDHGPLVMSTPDSAGPSIYVQLPHWYGIVVVESHCQKRQASSLLWTCLEVSVCLTAHICPAACMSCMKRWKAFSKSCCGPRHDA